LVRRVGTPMLLYSAPPRSGGDGNGIVRYSGTNTSSTEKSWLPVPFSAPTCQLSCNFTAARGNTKMRGWGGSSLATKALPANHSACSQPLANCQRPVRR
jgi:hypothetical protein